MGKVKRARRFRVKSTVPYVRKNDEKDASRTLPSKEEPALSRGQRRRRKGKERLRKRAAFEKEIKSRNDREINLSTNGMFGELDALVSSLPNAEKTVTSSARRGMTHKQRHRSCASEVAEMAKVLRHSSFKASPLGAIKQHLEATTPVPSS